MKKVCADNQKIAAELKAEADRLADTMDAAMFNQWDVCGLIKNTFGFDITKYLGINNSSRYENCLILPEEKINAKPGVVDTIKKCLEKLKIKITDDVTKFIDGSNGDCRLLYFKADRPVDDYTLFRASNNLKIQLILSDTIYDKVKDTKISIDLIDNTVNRHLPTRKFMQDAMDTLKSDIEKNKDLQMDLEVNNFLNFILIHSDVKHDLEAYFKRAGFRSNTKNQWFKMVSTPEEAIDELKNIF